MSTPVTGLLTLAGAARYCNVSRDTFRGWLTTDTGPRPWGKVGRYDRWAVTELDRYLARTAVAA